MTTKKKPNLKGFGGVRILTHLLYRLASPFEGNLTAWNFVSEDENTVVLFTFGILRELRGKWARLCGLDKDAEYKDRATGKIYRGDILMSKGLRREYRTDFLSDVQVFDKIK